MKWGPEIGIFGDRIRRNHSKTTLSIVTHEPGSKRVAERYKISLKFIFKLLETRFLIIFTRQVSLILNVSQLCEHHIFLACGTR